MEHFPSSTTQVVESAFYIVLKDQRDAQPAASDATTRGLRDMHYATADNASLIPSLDISGNMGGNVSNSSFMLAPTFNEVCVLFASIASVTTVLF